MIPFPEVGPLCPWETPDQAGHYAAVDHAQHAFEEFQRAFPDCGDLLRKGRMVLVSGGSGCGKTSLIHRCAHWLRNMPPPEGHQVKIIDLTRDHAKGASIEERMLEAWDRLLLDLRLSAGIFNEQELGLLRENGDKPAQAYETLSRLLQHKKWIFILLLPQSTLAEELVRYGGLAERGLLFFTETPYEEVAATGARQLAATAKPLRLSVGALGADDGWTYLSHYVGGGGPGPAITEATMREVVEGRTVGDQPMTVTELQRLMRGIFEYAAEEGKDDLTFNDFLTYTFRTARLI